MAKQKTIITNRIAFALLFVLCLGLPSKHVAADENIFDLSHARAALHYFEHPSAANISYVAFTDPTRKLTQFYNANSVDTINNANSTFEATKLLLNNMPDTAQLNNVKALLTHISDNEKRQNQCVDKTLSHLPENTKFENPLYIVWADGILANEDSVINVAQTSMLDITNKLFGIRPQAIWTSCIHALHHAAMNKLNPTPFTPDNITKSEQLLAYIEHITLFEGSAYYASNRDALAAININQTLVRFTQFKAKFANKSEPITDDDWLLFNHEFTTKKLGRDLGALMAAAIDENLGRQSLVRAYKGGAASFFQVYQGLN